MRLWCSKAPKTDEAGSGFQLEGWKPSGFFPSANGWIANCGTGDALLVQSVSAVKWSHREVRWVLSLTS
jgi:hypothetical protein